MNATRTRATTALDALMEPLEEEAFLEQYWARSPCVTHADLARVHGVCELPELGSVEALLDHVANEGKETSVRAWFQDATGAHESIHVTPLDAKRLYRSGAVTIVVDGLQAISQGVGDFLTRMHESLGTPAVACCNAYASPPGARTVMHFDPQESFLLQLRGEKHWAYAPNTEHPFPSEASNFYTNVPGHEGIALKFPREMPASASRVTLVPGSVLYLPRGTWHEAQSLSHSLGITLTFASKTWGDVILDELRERLMKEASWRMPATGIVGNERERACAEAVLEERLRALRSEVLAMCGEGD